MTDTTTYLTNGIGTPTSGAVSYYNGPNCSSPTESAVYCVVGKQNDYTRFAHWNNGDEFIYAVGVLSISTIIVCSVVGAGYGIWQLINWLQKLRVDTDTALRTSDNAVSMAMGAFKQASKAPTKSRK